jgi:hypothetical protein
MLRNGLFLVVDVAVREHDHPLTTRYKKALVLGTLREDVLYVPVVKAVTEYPSYSHFYKPGLPGGYYPLVWPGPRMCADRLYDKAVADASAGRLASAFVRVGRIVHLLTDMCIPSHAHRAMHLTDPFEWYVEGNKRELAALALPAIPAKARPSDLVESLARYTQRFEPDRTNHPFGRLMRRLGLRENVGARRAGEQARELVPMAVAHSVALLRMFIQRIEGRAPARGRDTHRAASPAR